MLVISETIYIAGKISGDPNYKEKFNAAQKRLEAEGYIVLNPAWFPPYGFEYEAYMRMSRAMLIECNEICFLPDWKDSNGAVREFVLARELGMKMRFLNQEHGKWFDKGSLSCRCDRCGCKSNRESSFCPNCGAKMDGEESGYFEKDGEQG